MADYILTVLDTAGIQNYVFGANQLKQNVGASYLVASATRRWVHECLPEPHNVNSLDVADASFTDAEIENDDELAVEVVYAGGGNTVMLFRSEDDAKRFARDLSRKVFAEAPGLGIVLVHRSFVWEQEALGGENGVVNQAMAELAKRKAAAPMPVALPGLSVTAECAFTGLPATDQHDSNPISADVAAKLDHFSDANKRLKAVVDGELMKDGFEYDFAMKFEDFGQSFGESNYIAVVHADGNGMGARVEAISKEYGRPEQNRQYIAAMRAFSESIRQAAVQTLKELTKYLIDSIEVGKDEKGKTIRSLGDERIVLKGNLLPFRPIVFGGDDFTFVAEGRLGLALAARYLEIFRDKTYSDNKKAYCRAGVAIVKTHYPFARAYDLAESLAASAKARLRDISTDGEATALDWHLTTTSMLGSRKEIREREYVGRNGGNLLMRPVMISDYDGWRTWANFNKVVLDFQTGDKWKDRRNKVKALRVALRGGPDAVSNFIATYDGVDALPKIDGDKSLIGTGWRQEEDGEWRCGYFDAIEMLDMYIPLNDPQQEETA